MHPPSLVAGDHLAISAAGEVTAVAARVRCHLEPGEHWEKQWHKPGRKRQRGLPDHAPHTSHKLVLESVKPVDLVFPGPAFL